MSTEYVIVVHKDSDSDYGVIVPDLPGCFTAGYSLDEALANAKEAIECHLEGLFMDNDAIPEQLPIEVHKLNEDYLGGTWYHIKVEPQLSRIQRSKALPSVFSS